MLTAAALGSFIENDILAVDRIKYALDNTEKQVAQYNVWVTCYLLQHSHKPIHNSIKNACYGTIHNNGPGNGKHLCTNA